VPWETSHHEVGHGRDITWTLRAKEAPQHIREAWIGTSWVVDVTASGTRDGKPFRATHLFLTSLRTTPDALLQMVRDHWCIEGWHWTATPSSIRILTAIAAMALEPSPLCALRRGTCCGWPVFGRFEPGYRR